MRAFGPRLTALVLTAIAGTGALAFSFTGPRWLDPRTTFHIGLSGTAPAGGSWSATLRDAMTQWTQSTAFTFVTDTTYIDPCAGLQRSNSGTGFTDGNGDGRNSADFRTTVCGNSFGSSVLAITLNLSETGALGFRELIQTDIVFNSNYQWDVYDGPQQSRVDFRRVALHELGHALGLDHESTQASIMAPRYGNLSTLQTDDIAGANALYAGSGSCLVRELGPSVMFRDRLAAGDCRVRDLFGGSDDTSFVDVYRLRLTRDTDLDIVMRSTELDAVLILADAKLGGIEIHDDFNGGCDAHIHKRLPAGEYRILANTYQAPQKCTGNTGGYSLTISDSGLPQLGAVKNAAGGTEIANTVITGGATANAGASFDATFTANQAIDVLGLIVPDPQHVGRVGHLYVLAALGDGRQFMLNSSRRFVPFVGGLSNLVPMRSGALVAKELVSVISGLKGTTSGLAGQTITVYLGYALDSNPQEVWYGSSPLRFTIKP